MNSTGELREEPGSAEALFAEWVTRVEGGELLDFDEFVRAHAAHAEALTELHEDWKLFAPILGKVVPGLIASDTGIVMPSLTSAPDTIDYVPSSELLARLGVRAPSEGLYRFRSVLGRGGGGVVLKVWDTKLNRSLAMKVVLGLGEDRPTGHTPRVDSRALTRFVDEARIAGQLDHPGIAPVHELGADETGRAFFTMKLVKGEDLSVVFKHLRTGKDGWNQTRALGVLLKVCEAMSYAHDKGVIHRDLKPANVMVGKYGEVYVMDWGLAHVVGREDKKDLRLRPERPTSTLESVRTERREQRDETPDSPLVTRDGDVIGTPSYMPPEQAQGHRDQLGPHSDVYSVGAMLYHLLSGEMPYVPKDTRISQHAILAALLSGPPRPLFELAPQIPAELSAICEKSMSRDSADRYPNMQALADDVRAYIEGRVVHAYETGAWAEARKWMRRNTPLAVALATVMLAIAAGAGAFAVEAKEATDARDGLKRTNTELGSTNSALEKAKSDALASAQRAEQKANDVLSLSAQQDLDDLVVRAAKLWPAHPAMIPEYEAWLKEARELIHGRPADPAQGLPKRLSLDEHKAKLAELRTKAIPLTAEQLKSDRESHPQYAELLAKQSELTWRSRMLGLEPWPSESEVEAQLATEALPSDAHGLNTQAWPLVDVDAAKVVYGSEVRALLLARRAVAAATESERAQIRDTLGWALYRCGRVDEALEEVQGARDEAQGKLKDDLSASLKDLQQQVARWTGADARSQRSAEAAHIGSQVAALERAVSERRTYEFAGSEDGWWYAQLSKLVSDLTWFTDEPSGGLFSAGVSVETSWGIVKRAEFARTIADRSVSEPQAAQLWSEAIEGIASSPKYSGLRLVPQMGLVPLGADPESGLWEFAHLQTGEPPVRGPNGKLVVTEAMGLVFVLIPGGTFWMGAQRTDLSGRNYDPEARSDESPVHEVTLSPYFLSKYEMTQGQWLRLAGRNPSGYGPAANFNGYKHDLTHPVESVKWPECMALMERLGLELPSEAQWEMGCRGGTDTPWWTGMERESLRGKVNLPDQSAAKAGAQWADIKDWPDLEDGWVVHAPVGSLAANPYGLHEVHGNVWEWCRDGYGDYAASRQIDPVAPWAAARSFVYRGGSFDQASTNARSAIRDGHAPVIQYGDLGLRPARPVTP